MCKCLPALMISGFLVSLSVHPAVSADPPAVSQAAGSNMVTEFKGTLKSFQRGVVVVLRDDGTEVQVQPPDDASAFQFVATAKPAFLQRGALLRFTGTFNQAGVPMSPVMRVELFQPITGKVAGHTREKYTPGIYPESKQRNRQPQAIANYNVVGGLMGLDVSSGAMVVQAGNRPVRAQLSPDAKFEIRYNNLNLAQEGDPISVAGFYQPPDDTKVKAERVTITTDRVYGDPSTEPPKRTSRRRSRTDKTEPEPDAAGKESGEGKSSEEKPAASAEAEGQTEPAQPEEAPKA